MPAPLNKPFHLLDQNDVRELFGWPESSVLEFKETLSGRDGRPNPWLNGGNFDRQSQNDLFKEVVALANAQGGHLVLGIAEDPGPPATAARINPIPRVADLADRLSRAASVTIQPTIPLLMIRGIQTEADGSGVIIFRVPASPIAPHRSHDKECYIRRDASSVPMTMREIQDLTLRAARREEVREGIFSRFQSEFASVLNQKKQTSGEDWYGFRISAVPVGADIVFERVYRQAGLMVQVERRRMRIDGTALNLEAINVPRAERSILRGTRFVGETRRLHSYMQVLCNGSVDFGIMLKFENTPDEDGIHPGWLIAHGMNLLETADRVRTAGGAPDAEYAVECEVSGTFDPRTPLRHALILFGFANLGRRHDFGQFDEIPVLLPRLSFGPLSEMFDILSVVLTDLTDAVGASRETRIQVENVND